MKLRARLNAVSFFLLAGLSTASFGWGAASENAFIEKKYLVARDLAAKSSKVEDLAILGWANFMLGDFSAAGAAFNKIGSSWPNDFDANLGLAWLAIKTGNFAEAEARLKKAEPVASTWQKPLVLDAKGWLALNSGDLNSAAKYFQAEEKAVGGDLKGDASVGLGWLAMRRNDTEQAAAEFNRGLFRDPSCFYCRDGLARIAYGRKQYQEALNQVLKGINETSDNPGLNGLLGAVLYALNDAELSKRTYTTLAARFPSVAAYRVGLGYVALATGDAVGAEVEFRKVLATDANNPLALEGINALQGAKTMIVKSAWDAYYRGEYDKALSQFTARRNEAAAARNPAAEDGRGWALLALGKSREAREAFQAALAIDPQFAYSRNGLAQAESRMLGNYQTAFGLIDLGRFDEAADFFARARAELPADMHWMTQDGQGWIALAKQDVAGAEKIFSATLASRGDAYLSELGLGRVAMERKDFSTAHGRVMKAIRLNPSLSLAAYTLTAMKFVDAGQHREAKEILLHGEKQYPYAADIHFLLARANAGLYEDGAAGASLSRAVELAPSYIEPAFDKVTLKPKSRQPALLSLAWGLYYAGDYAAAARRFAHYAESGGTDLYGLAGVGWANLALNNAMAARKGFETAIRAGNTGDAHAGLGWVQLNGEEVEEAAKSFKTALKAVPGHISALNGLSTIQLRQTALVKTGWDLYYKGDHKAALAAFDGHVGAAKAARNPAAEDGRGWALLAMGDVRAAAAAFENALIIDPDYLSAQTGRATTSKPEVALLQQGWAMLEAGQFDQAKARLDRAPKESSPDYVWRIDEALGWAAYYKKEFDSAEKIFRGVIAGNPSAHLAQRGLGYVAIERRQHAAAEKALKASYAIVADQGIAAYSVPAVRLIDARAATSAREILDLAEKTYPYSADIQFLLARAALGMNDPGTAMRHAASAATLAPAYIDPAFDRIGLPSASARDALASLAWGLYFAGDNAAALKRFDAALRAGSTDPNVSRGKGFALFRLGKLQEAAPLLDAARRFEPKSLLPIVETVPISGTSTRWPLEYTAVSTLAWVQYRLGAAARADELFGEAIAARPFAIDALTGRGYARLALKDVAGAKKYFGQALAISPTYPDALRGLAEAGKL